MVDPENIRKRYMELGQREKELRAELDILIRVGFPASAQFRAVYDLAVMEHRIADLKHRRDALYSEMQRILKGDPR